MYVLSCRMKAPVPIETAFAVFEDPHNLAAITPAWLHFRITTPGRVVIRKGARIEYEIRWLGIPISWETIITAYQPPDFFADEQARGPYKVWRHLHTFEAVEGGTMITDRVEYALRLGILGKIANSLAVERQLRGIFEYRGKELMRLLQGDAEDYEFSPVEFTST